MSANTPLTDNALSSRLAVVGAAALFSTGGVAIKACGLGPWQVASFRCVVATLALWLLVPATRRIGSWRSFVVGAAYAATMLLYVLANRNTTAAHAIFLQSTAPLYVLLTAPWVLGERSRLRDLPIMAVMAVGLGLVVLGRPAASTTAPDPAFGNLLALGAGVTFALTLLGLRWLGRSSEAIEPGRPGNAAEAPVQPRAARDSSLSAVIAGNLLAFVVALPMALPVVDSSATDWLLLIYLGAVQIGVAYALLGKALGKLPALEVSLLLLLEPVLNPLWAWLAYGENPGALAGLGALLLLLATGCKSWLDARSAGVVGLPGTAGAPSSLNRGGAGPG